MYFPYFKSFSSDFTFVKLHLTHDEDYGWPEVRHDRGDRASDTQRLQRDRQRLQGDLNPNTTQLTPYLDPGTKKKKIVNNLTRNCNPKKLDFIPPGVDTAPIVPALSRVFEAALAGIKFTIK